MKDQYDIALLTQDKYVNPSEDSDYVKNILYEDKLLTDALRERGLSSIRVSWSDELFDWSSVELAVFRTTWDYFTRLEEFTTQVSDIESVAQCMNPLETIRWNIDKRYLLDLKRNGVRVVPTELVEKGEKYDLRERFYDNNEQPLIIKPTVSATAYHTYKVGRDNLEECSDLFEELTQQHAMIVQPFQKNVTREGEISYMIIDGEYSHAVRKLPKPNDFRVQDDFGGTVELYEASREEIGFAEQAVRSCPTLPLYARVDAILDNDGKISLMELEMIEPELWFRLYPKCAVKFADAIASRCQ